MRTTLTIDDDLDALLRERARNLGISFREAVNLTLRRGLGRQDGKPKTPPPDDSSCLRIQAGNLPTDAHLAALAVERGYILHSTDRDFDRFPLLNWANPLH